MPGRSRGLLAAAMGMGAMLAGAAVAAAGHAVDTFRPSATIGTSRERATPAGKRKGISTAHQKRASKKKRNQARYKAACRR